MTKDQASGWLKANAASVVTWALIVVAGAAAWGVTRADVSTNGEKVTELRTDSRAASTERAKLRSDVNVISTKVDALSDGVSRAVVALDRLDRAVTRLEAVANMIPAGP